MYSKYILLFVLNLVFVDSKMSLFLITGPSKDRVIIKYHGADEKTVSPLEEKLFNITDANLKQGVKKELGKEPDDVFLKDPTRYGDLHERYNWTPVKRSVKVKAAKVIEVISDRVVVKSHEFINNSTITIKAKVAVSEIVESTISSYWSGKGLPDDDIYFDIEYNFNGRVVKFHNRWRHDNFQSASLPFEVIRNEYFNIQPGQRVTSRLKGIKTILLIEISYSASLVGQLVLNYAHTYGKYHFWAPKVADIIKAAGLHDEIITKEMIEVRCYTNPELEIFDSVTKKAVKTVILPPFLIKPKH